MPAHHAPTPPGLHPRTFPDSADAGAHRYLFVVVEDHRFCLRLTDIERLLPLARLQPVPNGPDYLIGLMNLRGEALPIVDLALRLGIPRHAGYRLDAPIVLADVGGSQAGLLVDDVIGVRAVPRAEIRAEGLFRDGLPPVLGAIVGADGTALVLDSLRILDLDLAGLAQPLTLDDGLLALCRQPR